MELPSFCDYCRATNTSIDQDNLGYLHQYRSLLRKHTTALDLSHISHFRVPLWRMNLMSISMDNKWLFIGHSNGILCFRLHRGFIRKEEHAPVTPHRNLDLGDCTDINQLTTGYLEDEPVLITVHDGGEVNVFETDHLDRPPTFLENGHESTWSLSSSGVTHMLAVGANSHSITVWDMTKVEEPLTIPAHNHNIPAIAFDETGKYIASASIDCHVAIHDAQSGQQIGYKKISSEWGWGIKWINKSNIRCIPSYNHSVWQLFDQFLALNDTEYESVDDTIMSNIDEDTNSEDESDGVEEEEEEEEEDQEAEFGREQSNEYEEREEEIGDDEESNEAQNIVELYNGESEISLNESGWTGYDNINQDEELEQDENREQQYEELFSESDDNESKKDGGSSSDDRLISELDDQLILYASKHKLFLLSPHLQVLASVRIDPFGGRFVPAWVRAMNRMIFLEWIPEVSSIVVGTQICPIAFIIRVVRDEYGSYRLIPEQYAKYQDMIANTLAGMTVVREYVGGQLRIFIYLLSIDGLLEVHELHPFVPSHTCENISKLVI